MPELKLKDVDDLCDLIEQRLNVDTRYWNHPYGWREGVIDKKIFHVFFIPNSALIISSEYEEIIDKLMPIMIDAMNGLKPQWKYNESIYTTIEWDYIKPKERLEFVKTSGGKFWPKVSNLELLSDRVYGIDPGNITDPEKVSSMDEIDLYLTISSVEKFMNDIKLGNGEGKEKALKEYEYALEYLIYQTRKFGIIFPEPKFWKHVPKTLEYKIWYNFYNKHFHGVLTEEEFEMFIETKKRGQDTSIYMPIGNWRDMFAKNQKKLGSNPNM